MSRAYRHPEDAHVSPDELHLRTNGPMIDQGPLPEPACWSRRLELRFDALPDDVQNALRGVTRHRSYAAGEPVFRRGERPLGLYRIDSGVVKVTRRMPDGPETLILDLRDRGESLGEETLFNEAPHATSAWALHAVDVSLVPRDDLWATMRDCPEFLEQLLVIYAARIQQAQDKLSMFYFADVETRLAAVVLGLAQRFGRTEGEAIRLSARLHRWDWAQLVGARVETVSRCFRSWAEEGWIRSQAGTLVLINSAPLETMVQTIY